MFHTELSCPHLKPFLYQTKDKKPFKILKTNLPFAHRWSFNVLLFCLLIINVIHGSNGTDDGLEKH